MCGCVVIVVLDEIWHGRSRWRRGDWGWRWRGWHRRRCGSRLAFILHTLEIRVRFQAGEDDMFLPNHLMVPWHAYMSCTAVLASNVDNLSQASWEALLAVKPPVGDVTEEDWEDEIEDEEPAFSSGGGKYDDDDDDVRPISSSQPSFKRSGSGASGRSGDAPYTNGAGVKSPEQSLGRL